VSLITWTAEEPRELRHTRRKPEPQRHGSSPPPRRLSHTTKDPKTAELCASPARRLHARLGGRPREAALLSPAGRCRARGISAPRLEQLDWVTGRVVENDLCSAWSGHDIIHAEGNPGRAQPRDFRSEVGHL
jgi:hypothetical protein